VLLLLFEQSPGHGNAGGGSVQDNPADALYVAGMAFRHSRPHSYCVAAVLSLFSALGGCATSTGAGAGAAAAPRLRSAPDDSDPIGVIPAGPETLLDVDVAQLRGSPWSRGLLLSATGDDRAAKTAARGFDDVADVDRAVFAVSEGETGPATLMVAQGRFDPQRLASALGSAFTAGVWRGSRVWEQGDHALALLTARTLLTGSPSAVRAAIDCAWGMLPDVRGAGVGELQRALDVERGHPAMTVIVAVTEPMRQRVGGEIDLPAGLERVGARLDLATALDLELLGLLATERDATAAAHNLELTVRDLRARRALKVFGLTAIFDEVTLRAEGKRVHGHLRLAGEKRDDLAAKIGFVLDTIVRARRK
jgi:hypothetical protein